MKPKHPVQIEIETKIRSQHKEQSTADAYWGWVKRYFDYCKRNGLGKEIQAEAAVTQCSALTEIAPYPCSYELYYGGFFDKPAGLILWDADYGIHEAPHCEFNWIGGHAPEVMATRFDLEAA